MSSGIPLFDELVDDEPVNEYPIPYVEIPEEYAGYEVDLSTVDGEPLRIALDLLPMAIHFKFQYAEQTDEYGIPWSETESPLDYARQSGLTPSCQSHPLTVFIPENNWRQMSLEEEYDEWCQAWVDCSISRVQAKAICDGCPLKMECMLDSVRNLRIRNEEVYSDCIAEHVREAEETPGRSRRITDSVVRRARDEAFDIQNSVMGVWGGLDEEERAYVSYELMRLLASYSEGKRSIALNLEEDDAEWTGMSIKEINSWNRKAAEIGTYMKNRRVKYMREVTNGEAC